MDEHSIQKDRLDSVCFVGFSSESNSSTAIYSLMASISLYIHLELLYPLDLVLASEDLERVCITHDIHASHIPASFTADGALA